MLTKNTCRPVPSALLAAMMRATTLSCEASPLFAGIAGTRVEAAGSAVRNWSFAVIERPVMAPISSSKRFAPAVERVSRLRYDADAVDELNRVPEMPAIAIAPLELTWYCSTLFPERYTALPEAEMQVKSVFVFWLASMSP